MVTVSGKLVDDVALSARLTGNFSCLARTLRDKAKKLLAAASSPSFLPSVQ
jgi:hypothetical protein